MDLPTAETTEEPTEATAEETAVPAPEAVAEPVAEPEPEAEPEASQEPAVIQSDALPEFLPVLTLADPTVPKGRPFTVLLPGRMLYDEFDGVGHCVIEGVGKLAITKVEQFDALSQALIATARTDRFGLARPLLEERMRRDMAAMKFAPDEGFTAIHFDALPE